MQSSPPHTEDQYEAATLAVEIPGAATLTEFTHHDGRTTITPTIDEPTGALRYSFSRGYGTYEARPEGSDAWYASTFEYVGSSNWLGSEEEITFTVDDSDIPFLGANPDHVTWRVHVPRGFTFGNTDEQEGFTFVDGSEGTAAEWTFDHDRFSTAFSFRTLTFESRTLIGKILPWAGGSFAIALAFGLIRHRLRGR